MGTLDKILQSVMSGKQDKNIKINDLYLLLAQKGFILNRVSGSHHIYSYPGIRQLIDLQPEKIDHSKAKAYQVKQVRNFFKNYLEV